MSFNNSSTLPPSVANDQGNVIGEETRVILFILILALSLSGVLSNVVNMLVFYRLQDGDPININLLGLAVSDFFVCLTTLVYMILTAFWILEDLFIRFKINAVEVFYIGIGIPHTVFVRISILLTALISLERCLCVVMPLKVKMIVSRGRVKVSVVLCFLVGILLAIPIYAANRLEWVRMPFLNVSVLRHVKTEEFEEMNHWFTPIEGVCLHVIPFLAVVVSTVVMVKSLKEKIAFRKSVAQNQSNNIVYKEKKVALMVLFMSVVFLTCNLPNIVMFLIVTFIPSFFSLGLASDQNLVMLLGFITIFLDTFNSSINVVIYFKNSSNYRDMLKAIFMPRRIGKR